MDIGWTELLVIGIVALVVVGPKDLPIMFKTFGRFMARARALGREFSRAMEQAADESGVKDVARDLKETSSAATSGIDKIKQAADKFEKWDPRNPVKSAAKAAVSTVTSPSAAVPSATAAAAATAAADIPAVAPETAAGTAAPLEAVTPPAPDSKSGSQA